MPHEDYTVESSMNKYRDSIDTFRVPRPRAHTPGSSANEPEHQGYRKLMGQLQWAARLMFYEEAFTAFLLSSKLASPTIRDIMDANAAIRRIKKHESAPLTFRGTFDPLESAIICVTESAFDHMPQHRPQRGHFLLLADVNMLDDHSHRHGCHCIAWQSSRIHRAVCSTLRAEAYRCSDAIDTLVWTRAVFQGILWHDSPRDAVDKVRMRSATITDCKPLNDTLTKERTMPADKRLSLEAAILRQSLTEIDVKWVKSEQMLADVLTKAPPGSYARETLMDGTWTLGPDSRAPSTRGRRLAEPDRVATTETAQGLNDRLQRFEQGHSALNSHVREADENEISTALAEDMIT